MREEGEGEIIVEVRTVIVEVTGIEETAEPELALLVETIADEVAPAELEFERG